MSLIQILAESSTSISELKKNPMSVIELGDGFPVAVLNRNKPVYYAVPAEAYALMLDKLEDMEIAELVRSRAAEPVEMVSIDDL